MIEAKVESSESLTTSAALPRNLEHQIMRLRFVARMAGLIGAKNTARATYNRLVSGQKQTPIEITSSSLRHPLTLTSIPSDVWSIDETLRRDVYRLPNSIDQTRINGRTIVDLGANIGAASCLFASRFPNSKVIAVEPHPRNLRLLQANAATYRGQIEVIDGAVVPEAGSIAMKVFGSSEQNYMANGFHIQTGVDGSECRPGVRPVTPGDIITELDGDTVGLLKVDIEGAEAELFGSNAVDPLLELAKTVAIETHDRFVPGAQQIVGDKLALHGFSQIGIGDLHTNFYSKP